MYNVFQRKHHCLLLYYFERIFGLLGLRTAFPCSPSNSLQFSSPLYNPISNMNNMNPPVYASKEIWVVIFHDCLKKEGQGGCQAIFLQLFSAEIY